MVSTSPPPACDAASTGQQDELDIALVANPSSHELLVSLIPPTQPQSAGEKMTTGTRAPLDLCLVIDVSGSMEIEAPVPGKQGKNETTGLSVLDIVKHATRTILESLNDDDRIAIVTFSDSAEVIVNLTPTTKENRDRVWNQVDRLYAQRSTNLWDGLKTGMNLLTKANQDSAGPSVPEPRMDPVPQASPTTTASPKRSSFLSAIGLGKKKKPPAAPSSGKLPPSSSPTKDIKARISSSKTRNQRPDRQRLSAVFILTDGQPNVEPPRGHIPMLKHYLEALPADSPKFTISTFGFGYDLDSRLLDEIADLGQGTYGFIPDSGMIGTVFIHALANLMATWARGCTLDIELTDQSASTRTQVEVLGALPVKVSSGVASIQIGDIQYGQSRDVVVKLPAQYFTFDPDHAVNITTTYSPHTLDVGTPALQTTRVLDRGHETNQSIALQHQVYRLSFIRVVSELVKDYHQNENLLNGSQLQQALANHTDNPSLGNHEPSTALTSDITSQVVLGLQSEHWSRWGKHYIPSLARSHQLQQCSNFKDPGLQMYGRDSPLFTSTRDSIDGKFDSLPPPKPSLANQSSYYTRSTSTSSAPFARSPVAPRPMMLLSTPGPSPGPRSRAASCAGGRQQPPPSTMLKPCARPPGRRSEVPRSRSRGRSRSEASLSSSKASLSSSESLAVPDHSFVPVSSMSEYNSRSAPCFAGWCLVDAGNGQKVKVSDLRRGTTVVTPAGTSRVAAVLRTTCPGGVADLCLLGALAVTPWHPIEHNGRWVFPADVCQPSSVPCDCVYSVLLEPSTNPNAHALCIGGVWCITLGHGCTDPVRAHPFLGDYARVVNSLSQMKGYYSETGVIDGSGVVRDDETGLVCGFRGPEVEYARGRETCDSLQWVTCEV